MGKTKLASKLMLLEPAKAAMLADVAKESRILQSVLMREAIDDLLTKYGKLKPNQYRKPK